MFPNDEHMFGNNWHISEEMGFGWDEAYLEAKYQKRTLYLTFRELTPYTTNILIAALSE
jgi:hypothetical protein